MELKLLEVREATGIPYRTTSQIPKDMSEEAKADRECFWVLHLDGKNKLIVKEKELISMGSLTASIVHPRETFRKAIINSAAAIITVHNHPSGDPTPSSDDLKIWHRLNDAGELLGIKVLDHFVITPNGAYYSATDAGV